MCSTFSLPHWLIGSPPAKPRRRPAPAPPLAAAHPATLFPAKTFSGRFFAPIVSSATVSGGSKDTRFIPIERRKTTAIDELKLSAQIFFFRAISDRHLQYLDVSLEEIFPTVPTTSREEARGSRNRRRSEALPPSLVQRVSASVLPRLGLFLRHPIYTSGTMTYKKKSAFQRHRPRLVWMSVEPTLAGIVELRSLVAPSAAARESHLRRDFELVSGQRFWVILKGFFGQSFGDLDELRLPRFGLRLMDRF
ncbi:hypothetical protein CASFOL_009482 [Castilleja foliolosa]|uniref:Ribosomal protein L5 n=1 Tax=Castilleja foliolosa TaxID=1961234 RepID=A0ABD3DXT0_9LAMI